MPQKKLYVGNLSYDVTQADLEELFAKAGEIENVTVIIDRFSGRSKGFAFVEMKSVEEAKKAIEMFDGKDLKGRNMVVNEARPQQPRGIRERRPNRY